MKLFEEIRNASGIAFSLHRLGFAANGLGEHADAEGYFGRCLQTAREIDDKWLISIALHFIAVGTSLQGNYEMARSHFDECIALMKQGYGTAQGIAYSEFHLGRIARIHDDFPSARVHTSTALESFMHMDDKRGLGYSLFGLACLAQVQEDSKRAATLFGAIDAIRNELGALLEAVLQSEYEQTRSAVQEMLGEESFRKFWDAGRELLPKQIIQFALNPE